jgi:hypothetical protein
MPAAVAVPLITGALGAGASVYSANKQAKAAKEAATLSPMGVQAQQGLTKQAGRLNQMGDRLLGQGTADLERVGAYWRPQLSGDRAAVSQAIAPDVAATTDVYRGAERSLDRSGVRGAQAEQQRAELRRQKTSQIAQMPMMQRRAAADALAGIGGNYFSTGANAIGSAGNLLGQVYSGERGAATQGQGYMLAQGQENNKAFQQGAGQLFGSVLDYYKNRTPTQPLPAVHTSGGYVPYAPSIQPNRP